MARRGSGPGQTRASGETAAQEEAEKGAKEFEQPPQAEIDVERDRMFEGTLFSRMRMDWRGDDAIVVKRARDAVEGRILTNFSNAYAIMSDLYDVVRTPQRDESGQVVRDPFGFPIWTRLPSGAFEEDWSRLTTRQREDFLYRITTQLFDWEQMAADAWGEAMLAKAQWQEKFSVEYDRPAAGTIEDRTAVGNTHSADERYFAIFLSWYSRRADAIVRQQTLLSQRLKDTLS